ncbi:eukaryotic translation initiation factor 4E-like [Watersipora subatra]|uniref:eukaryotic translation initiation factor 4E-like n=1 Tax=Watersipora subatra TaxID=2589382 RepID=UPI00355ADC11
MSVTDSTEVDVTEDHSAEISEVKAPLAVKHPLQNTWALWYFKNDRSKDWSENLKIVAKFQFVEDFWALYNHIQPASRLANGCDYSLFKDGIKPEWEDPRNCKGGRWLISLNKGQRATELDHSWMEILLCLIGEAFEDNSDEICGATVNIRPKVDKLSLWTANAGKKDATCAIGKKLKERLGVPNHIVVGYEVHEDTKSRKGSMAKNRYTV